MADANNHTKRGHARLAPSSASRWMACPGSVRLSDGIPDRGSVYADEGTAAHMLAEKCLRLGADANEYAGWYVSLDATDPIREKPQGERSFLVDDEMVDGVQTYLDYVGALIVAAPGNYAIEQRIEVTPDIYGTADFVAYEQHEQHLHVCDFKYGRGVAVDPKANPQLLCYGAGAHRKILEKGKHVKKLTLHVIQPRAPHPDGPTRKWPTDTVGVATFRETLVKAAVATAQPNAPIKAGEHCKFCPVSPMCPERRRASLDAAGIEFSTDGGMKAQPVATLSSEDLGRLLSEIDQIEDWCRRVREHAHAEATHGRLPEGWKLVAKRAIRKWKDEANAERILRAAFDLGEEALFKRSLISPAGAEKLLGKANAKHLNALVTKESSGTVLAPEDDPRQAVLADPNVEFGG